MMRASLALSAHQLTHDEGKSCPLFLSVRKKRDSSQQERGKRKEKIISKAMCSRLISKYLIAFLNCKNRGIK